MSGRFLIPITILNQCYINDMIGKLIVRDTHHEKQPRLACPISNEKISAIITPSKK